MLRKAFQGELPEDILRRGGKGSPNSWLVEMIKRDADFIRDFLMGGVLVKNHVVDKGLLEQALPGSTSYVASHGGGVCNLLYTEAWARSWQDVPRPL